MRPWVNIMGLLGEVTRIVMARLVIQLRKMEATSESTCSSLQEDEKKERVLSCMVEKEKQRNKREDWRPANLDKVQGEGIY